MKAVRICSGALRAPATAVIDRRYSFILCAFLCLVVAIPVMRSADDLASRVIILANSRQPESVRLAEFYAEKRAVPVANIIALPLPEAESITWREFIDQVYQPLQDELHRRGWLEGTGSSLLDRLGRRRFAFLGNRISYLVVCRGVPLRIYNDPTLIEAPAGRKIAGELNKNEAAVDSELSLLGQSGYEITAMLPNSLFSNEGPPTFDAGMVVKVARLDGPTWESVRHLVTSALEAERTGLLGRYYIDLKGPHADGDKWLEATRAQLQVLGFEGDTEPTAATFGVAARFDAPVFYFGWYANNLGGAFGREGFAFPPGAIALHIHSFSAPTLHNTVSGWCGPFVARGVAATVGNVFEPYLGFTHRPDLLLQALSRGSNFGDAVYYSLPVLGWQAIAIGDPLYRPFKVSLDEQLQAVASLPPALAGYAAIRSANLLAAEGRKPEAIARMRTTMRERAGLAPALTLARLALEERDTATAVGAVGFAPALKSIRPEDWPLMREIARLLAANGARPAALQVYANLARAKPPTPELGKELLTEARTVADAAGDLKHSLEFARQLSELAAPGAK
jgi:uncharacterized protein (TIGR03790 family)